ncbi:uncharacterized protein [Argopecten irradians]|uniref:uncharacterized protein n=1 Tax=Argopecten irradians TaxID=31199 RepID=UPI0037123F9B
MSERRVNHGYLETDIDDVLEDTSIETKPTYNGGNKISSRHSGNTDSIGVNKDNGRTEKISFADSENSPEVVTADIPLIESSKDEAVVSSTSPFLSVIPRKTSDTSTDDSEVKGWTKDGFSKEKNKREILTVLAICLGISMSFIFLFLLVTSLIATFWEPANLAKFCNDIHRLGYTSQACQDQYNIVR